MARINIPTFTRSLLILIIGLTTLNVLTFPAHNFSLFLFFGRVSPLIGIVPGESYKFPWTFVTATFVERNLFGLLVNTVSVLFGGRYLERAWGVSEFGKYILVISIIPNVISWLLYFILPSAPICGGIAIQAGFLVAFKQLVPEHTVSLLRGTIRMRVKHFPAIFLAANIVSGIILRTETAMFLSWIGFLSSWVYLRFYRVSPLILTSTGDSASIRGDASDTFAFAYFFPEPFLTPLANIGDAVYNLLISFHICTPWSVEDIEAGNDAALARTDGGGLPTTRGSGRREEAERRRALALKALDQRLHAAASRGTSSAPVSITVPAPVMPPENEAEVEPSKVDS